ncbi:dimethylmenaquinone methyltransferase [Acinetobacter sp. TGL-Y2]|uniref:RraA family protein n=1 Tax=Acinetobacter sp. TGL-Y2 TaxID=1407071 RepID=UPI0007A65EC1|nr:RraA family protein [Acinetobacter sp. TGL-Y2]AMW78120.1 dimethylmenaquinone methyltransferase [Acinetobacter sp. TGL-Y2]
MSEPLNFLLTQYAFVASSTIGHVLDTGYLPKIHAVNSVQHVVGIVRTVTLNSINAMQIRHALLESKAGDILVIDARKLGYRACWGEQRHRAAIYHQLAAIVVIGAVTDIDALKTMKVPVFAQTVSSLTTRSEGESFVDFDHDIHYLGSTISTGDLMVADADGIFILKPDIAAQYLEKFQHMELREKQKRDQFFSQHSLEQYYHANQ